MQSPRLADDLLAGLQVPPEQSERLDDFLQEVGYRYVIEDENAIRANFL